MKDKNHHRWKLIQNIKKRIRNKSAGVETNYSDNLDRNLLSDTKNKITETKEQEKSNGNK